MSERNWIVRIYDGDNVIDQWRIENRTESQAESEASADYGSKYAMRADDEDHDFTFTLTPEDEDSDDESDLEHCDRCGEKLQTAQIGLCDDCLEDENGGDGGPVSEALDFINRRR